MQHFESVVSICSDRSLHYKKTKDGHRMNVWRALEGWGSVSVAAFPQQVHSSSRRMSLEGSSAVWAIHLVLMAMVHSSQGERSMASLLS